MHLLPITLKQMIVAMTSFGLGVRHAFIGRGRTHGYGTHFPFDTRCRYNNAQLTIIERKSMPIVDYNLLLSIDHVGSVFWDLIFY